MIPGIQKELYIIELKIGSQDVTGYLLSLNMTFSLLTIWPVIQFSLLIDPIESLVEELLRQQHGSLSISLMKEHGQLHENVIQNLELFVLTEDTVAHTRTISARTPPPFGSTAERVPVTFTALVKNAIQKLSTLVNETYMNQKLEVILRDLSSKAMIPKLQLRTEEINETILDQVVVPPLSYIQSIRYLDFNFGIFPGPLLLFYTFDDVFRIESLHANMLRSPEFTIYALAADHPDLPAIIERCTNGTDYYTIDPVQVVHGGHAFPTYYGNTQKIISSPKDTLFYKFERQQQEIAEKSISDPSMNLTINSEIQRSRYIVSHTGYERDKTFIDARLTRDYANLSQIHLEIFRNTYMYNLMKIGEPVLFYPLTIEYGVVGEKYLLKASSFSFQRVTGGPEWHCRTIVSLLRTPIEVSRSQPV